MAAFLTAAGLVLTVLLAYMQIQRTHASTIAAQDAHLRNELMVRTYESASGTFLEAANLLSQAASKAQSPLATLSLQLKGTPIHLTVKPAVLSEPHYTASTALSGVLIVLEQYEIAFARFTSFRKAFSEAHGRWLEAYNPFYMKILLFLPLVHEATGAALPALSLPTPEAVAELQGLLDTYIDLCIEMQGYLIDVQIEPQNELLGGLFERQLPSRSPDDPKYRVVSRDPAPQLKRQPGALV